MSGRILIIDTVATNRIVLKVKLGTAQFEVDTCGSCQDAEALIAAARPDLVLINLSDRAEDRHAFCRRLRAKPATASIGIVGIGVADTARARFAALDAGADDVLPRPISDALMLARIRSLMRQRHAGQEYITRDGSGTSFGFEEEAMPLLGKPRLAAILSDKISGGHIRMLLSDAMYAPDEVLTSAAALSVSPPTVETDVFLIDGSAPGQSRAELFQTIAALNSRSDTRHAAKMVVVAPGQFDLAAMLLDTDIEEVVFADVAAPELGLRIKKMSKEKQRRDILREKVRSGLRAAVTDPLTGLHNRRFADTHLNQLTTTAAREGREYALMMVDIDHFKSINDRFGHAAGDIVLSALADRVRQNFRGEDLIARIGGEEFLIAMPDTSSEQAEMAAERLRRLIHSRPFNIGPGKTPLPVTVSVGVAHCDAHLAATRSMSDMFSQADAALYEAKSAGRNAVSVAANAAA